jgi:ElaB/YqjD/DUF883 family membrane-anchored ribosome-binding protein
MADPLHNNAVRDFNQRAELNRGSRVAYQPLEDPLHTSGLSTDRELPDPRREYPYHQLREDRLVRVAEQIGGALGKTVSQARRMPGSARHGIHLVSDRAQEMASDAVGQISSSAASLAGNAQQRTEALLDLVQSRLLEFTEMTQQRAEELMEVAEKRGRIFLDRADELGQQICERTGELKQELDERTRELRMNARMRVEDAKYRTERVVRERPLHVLGGIAAAAFILGVSLRIVRSRNARGY